MPRANSFVDDDIETFPLHVRLAHGEDMSWWENAKCKGGAGNLLHAWHVRPKEQVKMGESTYLGSDLISMALEFCRVCPAQWDCSQYALRTAPYYTYVFGTWGVHESDLRWIHKRGDGHEVIERARENGVPVQVAVRQHRLDANGGRLRRRSTAA